MKFEYANGQCDKCAGTGKALNFAKIAAALDARRESRKLQQQEVARRMGITRSYLSALLRQRERWNLDLLRKFERAIAA